MLVVIVEVRLFDGASLIFFLLARRGRGAAVGRVGYFRNRKICRKTTNNESEARCSL